MCNAIRMPELIEDPRFIDNTGRTGHYDAELRPIVEEYTKKSTKQELEDPELGKFKTTRIPIKLEKSSGAILKLAPKLGQDSDEILKSLGYSEEEIKKFYENGII